MRTTWKKAQLWEVINPLLSAMYAEFKEFSKKKPDAAVSKSKIAMANRLLEKCRELLEDEPSLAYLDELNEDDIPQNSDLVLVLSQYATGLRLFRSKYKGGAGASDWKIEGEDGEVDLDDDLPF